MGRVATMQRCAECGYSYGALGRPEMAPDSRARERQAERRVTTPRRELREQSIDPRRGHVRIGSGLVVDLERLKKSARVETLPPEELRERPQQRD